jgi:hypothetical protein
MPQDRRDAFSDEYTPNAVNATLSANGQDVRCWTLEVPAASGISNWTVPIDIEVVDVVVKKRGIALASTLSVRNLTNPITDAMDLNVVAGVVVRPTFLNPANTEISAGGTLRVVTSVGATNDCEVDVYWIRT